MSEIIKTKALVLKKLDYGDTSKIATFFTEDFGKISAIIKGARSPKSKIGSVVDVLNLVQLVYYKKTTREVQLVSQVDLGDHYPKIKEDLDKLKYSSSIVELLIKLIAEDEPHKKLFSGTIRIFDLINESLQPPEVYFVKYILFLLKEIGYEIQLDKCSICGKGTKLGMPYVFNYNTGFLCEECKKDQLTSFEFSAELFKLLICLSRRKNDCEYNKKDINKLIFFLEKYIVYHVPEFKGLKSLQVY